MGKGKSGRGGRGGRHGGGHDGRKQSIFDPTLDTEMVDAPPTRGDRSKQNQARSSGFQTQHENNRRGRVGKAARDVPQTQPSIFNQGTFSNAPFSRQPSTRPGPSVPGFSSQNLFVNDNRKKSRRASIVTCISALSTQVGRGPYCYKCARTNRKLRQALFDLLEKSFKDGKKLVEEWAWEAGVSPDHMECERTKMHIIPEGLRSENEPCHSCKAKILSRNQSHSRTSVLPPWYSQAPGMLGPRLPPTGTHQPAFSLPQQKSTPFIQTAPVAFERQLFPIAASEVPNVRSWTAPDTRSMVEQTATYARCVVFPDQVSQSQAQQYPQQLQQQDLDGGKIRQFADGRPNDPNAQHPDQGYQIPGLNHIVEQATAEARILSPVNQENRCANPHMPPRQTPGVEEAPNVQMPKVQQNSFHHLPLPLGDQSKQLTTILATPAAPAQDAEQNLPTVAQSRQEGPANSLITPPHSDNKTLAKRLNAATETSSPQSEELSVAAGGASSEVIGQNTEEGLGNVLDLDLAPEQPSHIIAFEHEKEQARKYCCEVIPSYAL